MMDADVLSVVAMSRDEVRRKHLSNDQVKKEYMAKCVVVNTDYE